MSLQRSEKPASRSSGGCKDGEAIEVLKLLVRQKLIVSKYLTNLLTSATESNLQSIRSSMLTADKDFALPYLSINGQTIKVEGSALFSTAESD